MSEVRDILLETTNKIMKDLSTKEVITEVENGKWPSELWNTLEETGITGISIPEEKHGSGGTLGDALSVLQTAGYYAAPVPLAETMLAKWILSSCGITIPTGPLVIVTHSQGNTVRFKKSSKGWTISGLAKKVPWARFAKGVVVIGCSGDTMIAALLNPGSYTINHGENLAGEPLDEVIFNNVEAGIENVKKVPEHIDESELFLRGALTRIALMGGALERVLDLTVQYAKERTQFGRAIGRFQAVQQQLAVLAGEVTAAGMAAKVAISESEETADPSETAIAKIAVGQAVGRVVPIAHQVHGAIGFTDEHALQQSTRRLWVWRDEYGNESEWADRLGQEVLLKGSEGVWPFITR